MKLRLQVAVAEAMVWRTVGMLERLNLEALSSPDDGQSVAANTDMPVTVQLFAVSDLDASVRFALSCMAYQWRHVRLAFRELHACLPLRRMAPLPLADRGHL